MLPLTDREKDLMRLAASRGAEIVNEAIDEDGEPIADIELDDDDFEDIAEKYEAAWDPGVAGTTGKHAADEVLAALPPLPKMEVLPNDTRSAHDLDAYLRARGVSKVVTTFLDDGTATVVAYLPAPKSITGTGETASHAFDAMLGALK